jgi:hypothetical protein
VAGTALADVARGRARVAKVLPEPLTTGPMRALPIVLLFGAMFYWLWKVGRSRGLSHPVIARMAPDGR